MSDEFDFIDYLRELLNRDADTINQATIDEDGLLVAVTHTGRKFAVEAWEE